MIVSCDVAFAAEVDVAAGKADAFRQGTVRQTSAGRADSAWVASLAPHLPGRSGKEGYTQDNGE
jgi:hypothetical protein